MNRLHSVWESNEQYRMINIKYTYKTVDIEIDNMDITKKYCYETIQIMQIQIIHSSIY